MNPRKEATYRMLSLIAAVIFVLPCVFLVFLTFDINPDDLWQMDSLMEFICAYKNTAILAIAGVLIQIVIALPAGYAIARIPSPNAGTARSSLPYGGQHGQMCPIAIWIAPGRRNALTTEVTLHGVWMRFLPSMRVRQRRRWSAGALSLTVAN